MKEITEKEINRTKKIINKIIEREVRNTKIPLTKKELWIQYIGDLTKLEPLNLTATFSRILLFCVSILRFVEHSFFVGLILLSHCILLSYLNFHWFKYRLKSKIFIESLDDNIDEISEKIISELVAEGLLEDIHTIELEIERYSS